MTAVGRPFALEDVAFIDQLLEYPPQALLGDLQDIQKIGDTQARVPVDEMQHPVMGAAEANLRQDRIRIADEIAIGEEQQFDQIV